MNVIKIRLIKSNDKWDNYRSKVKEMIYKLTNDQTWDSNTNLQSSFLKPSSRWLCKDMWYGTGFNY